MKLSFGKKQKNANIQTETTLHVLLGMFAEVLQKEADEISPDADFFNELGGDSLSSLQVITKAEERFGVTIPDEAYLTCRTANDFADVIDKLLSGEYTAEASDDDKTITPITRFEDTPEYKEFTERMKEAEGHNPYFTVHDSALKDVSIMDGREVLNFSSYNYVGMSGRKETVEAAKKAAEHYGTSASGSRLLGGEKPIHRELEETIAKWKHTEDAVVMVGGHSTNVTVVGNFCGKHDLIVYDVLAHNSISEGCRLSDADSRPFPHNDYNALETILKNCRDRYAKVLIVIEGVYSMDGDIAPVPEFVKIKKQYGCFLMVDEAHSACVLGEHGGGVDEYFGLDPYDIDIKMGTLSKGIGTCGGYIAGKKCMTEYMRYNIPGFVFSVGMSPVLAAAAKCAIELLQKDTGIMADLHRNIKVFVDEAHKRHFNTCLASESAIIPIMVGKDEDAYILSTMLRQKGVFVPPAVYPAVPKGKSRLRFCVISEHKPEQIIKALDTLDECCRQLGITLPQ